MEHHFINNGIQVENQVKTCPEVVRGSLIEAEDGSIRFKTEGQKGKKPTLFTNQSDFSDGVAMLQSLSGAIAKKAKTLK